MGITWRPHGHPIEAAWASHGGRMGTPWRPHGHPTEAAWAPHGGRMGITCAPPQRIPPKCGNSVSVDDPSETPNKSGQ